MSTHAPTLYVAEPPTAYLYRPPMVVDCSVIVAALFEEETRAQAYEMMVGKTLCAPYLLDVEFVSVALKKSRLGWPAPSVKQALADYAVQNIELYDTDIPSQYALALRYNLSAYDAAYLWLAAELKTTLATFDKKLALAAKTHFASLP